MAELAATRRHIARHSQQGAAASVPPPWFWPGLFLLSLVCLLPATLNRFPLVFPDTETYLAAAQAFRPAYVRAFGYSAFLRAAGSTASLWLPAAAQALLSSYVVLRFLSLEAPTWPRRYRPALLAAFLLLLALGHLPWLASWLQPDVFTGDLMLLLLLLTLHGPGLGRWERGLLTMASVGLATTHLTHLPLLGGLGVAATLLALLPRRIGVRPQARRAAAYAFAATSLGWLALAGCNLVTYHRASPSLGNSVFMFARLQADGDAAGALRPTCTTQPALAVCHHLDRLGLPADEFLWRPWSPLPAMGDIGGFFPEASRLDSVLLRRFWPSWLERSVLRAGAQLAAFGLGDGMDSEGPTMLIDDLPRYGMDRPAFQMVQARQTQDGLAALMPRTLADGLALGGLLGTVALGAYGAARRRPALWFPAALFLIAYLGNAALIGLGGEVHARYGARLVWVAPLLAGVLALRAKQPGGPAPR